jgi:long-chain fatty acid transport protein
LTSGETKVLSYQGATIDNGISYSFGNDVVTALSASLKVKW